MINRDVILECLNGVLGGIDVQKFQDKLDSLAKEQGFGLILTEISVGSNNFSVDTRQLSCVILKKFIDEHWDDDSIEPDENNNTLTIIIISEQEKSRIKELLSPCLSDSSSKIRTAIAMCIGKIGCYEWPTKWPSLMDDLIKCILPPSSLNNKNLFNGALKCLEILFDPEYLEAEHLIKLVQVVFPIFHQMLLNLEMELEVHIKIIGIFKAIVNFVTLVGAYDKQFNNVFVKLLPTWVDIFTFYLSKQVSVAEQMNELFTVQTGILEILAMLFEDTVLRKKMVKFVSKLLPPVWSLFNGSFSHYERTEILGDYTLRQLMVDKNVTRIDSLVSSLFEFLVSIIDIKVYRENYQNHLQGILYNCLLYIQMSSDLVEQYENDTNQFLELEADNKYIPRIMSMQLITKIVDTFRLVGLKSLFTAIQTHFAKSEDRQNPNWWRYRESSIVVLYQLHDYFVASREKVFDFSQLLRVILSKDILETGDQTHLLILRGASLKCASKYSKGVAPELSLPYLTHSVEILIHQTIPLSLKVQAMEAISGFSPNVPKENLKIYIPSIIKGIIDLLPQITDLALTLALDALLSIVKVDQDITGTYEHLITPQLLRTWTAYSHDDLISQDIKEIFKLVCLCPKSYPGILQRLFETLNIILEPKTTNIYSGILESAIDILGVVMANYKDRFETIILDKLFAPLVSILMQQDNQKPVVKASLCALVPFIYRIPAQEIVNWKHPILGYQGVMNIFVVIQKYLSDEDEFIALNVPPLITGILLRYNEYITNDVHGILTMVLNTFYKCRVPSFKQSLISIFTRLIYQHTSNVIDFLNTVPSPLGSNQTAFTFLLNEWCKYHADIQNKLDLNLSVLCFMKLYTLGDKRLDGLMVDDEVVLEGTTRSATAKLNEKWTTCPFYIKVTRLLIATLELESMDKATLKKFQMEQYKQNQTEEEDFDEDLYVDDDGDDYEEDDNENDGFDDADKYDLDGGEYDENDFDFELEEAYDPISKEDPIYHVDIAVQIKEFLHNLQNLTTPTVFEQVTPFLNQYKVNTIFEQNK
ncbi:actin binding protein [Tieghemostelium lacteum]|uniref:Actin binding protein n=1 Tax=Tieghemostelium lacteum TaxID=361077 RepID=A0A151Z5U5_TIELA|nr:actin binding protein [Tieghemostelium lacteum]|eukprot:KYQ89174.1 actin binding protein [Tieghemostelium lacteum]